MFVVDLLPESKFMKTWPIALTKNKLIEELPYIGKEYSVSFEVFINKMPTAETYVSVLHLTIGGNMDVMGSRNPGVWVKNTKELFVGSAISGNLNAYKMFPVEENKWHKVDINQKLVDGKVVNTDL